MEVVLYMLLGGALVLALGFAKRRFLSFLSQSPDDYLAQGPEFDLREHLNGLIKCEGVIYGPTGRVTSRFVGDFDAHWQGNHGVMREHFHYDSGTTQDREWALELDGAGHIRATADDVIGVGEGRQSGSAVQLRYRIRLPESAGGHVLDVIDWMYLAPNGTIVNRSQFRKFGIQVAELVATMRPVEVQIAKRDAA